MGWLRIAPLLLAWGGLFCLCREAAARRWIDPDWRLSWTLASIGWGTVAALMVELSSLGRLLTAGTLFAGWTLVCFVLFLSVGILSRRRGVVWRNVVARGVRQVTDLPQWAWPKNAVLVWGCVGVFVLALAVIALDFPTTTGDSLTYHLARIMHWMQDRSVAHYPTHNCRQNELGPWAEFATVTLHLLWGNDRLVNLAQWFAMLSCVLVTPLLGARLLALRPETNTTPGDPGAAAQRRRVGAFTALLVVTLPVSIVEAVTTQNDYITAFWLVSMAILALELARKPRHTCYALGGGLAFSLGVLTKATMIIYAGPILLALAWRLWSRGDRWQTVATFVFAFALLNAGHIGRNYSLVKSPFAGPSIHHLVVNQRVSLGGTMSNVIRNVALETTTPFPWVNQRVNGLLSWLHGLTGRDLNDPETTYELCLFRWLETLQIYDSQVSNPFHLLLILAAVVLAVGRLGEYRALLGCAALVGASFLLFCALLRWQEWNSRLHLPYLVLLMPFAAALWTAEMTAATQAVAVVLAVTVGVHTFAANESRPLWDPTFTRISREAQYGAIHGPHFYDSYNRACSDVIASGCTNVGLKLQYGDFEYVFWVMLKNRGFKGRLEHVFVEDVSAKIPRAVPPPCVVITTFDPLPPGLEQAFRHRIKYPHASVCWGERKP